MLDLIKDYHDLRTLDIKQLSELAEDIRQQIISTTAENGGHLSSNLGAVDLTVSLLWAFDPSVDKILWDVGHQCYAYKILTDRKERFSSIRKTDGLSGFLRTDESEYDLFNTGHASSSLSLALGLAKARDLNNGKEKIVTVIGDGAMTGGMAYEALNEIGSNRTKMIIILNDNGMSISKNVGAMANYLSYLRVSRGWQKIKKTTASALKKIPFIGQKMHDIFLQIKNDIRNIFVHDKFFSSLDIRYFGPIDGHNINAMERIFARASQLDEPVVIHVMTSKGEGYDLALEHPDMYHGIDAFDPDNGEPKIKNKKTSGEIACEALCGIAKNDKRVFCITAAMVNGTGMTKFREEFPERFEDVGIAEEHAVSLAAGMARGGMKPVVAIYDTFFQRAYDQLLEDVSLQKLNVVFLSDRAELASGDGLCHHGVFGISFFSSIPSMTVLMPCCTEELRQMIAWALQQDHPVAIRYSKHLPVFGLEKRDLDFVPGKWRQILPGDKCVIIACGRLLEVAVHVSEKLRKEYIECGVYSAGCVNNPDMSLLSALSSAGIPVFTLEENVLNGGFGMLTNTACIRAGLRPPRYNFTVPEHLPDHGERNSILDMCGLSSDKVFEKIMEMTV